MEDTADGIAPNARSRGFGSGCCTSAAKTGYPLQNAGRAGRAGRTPKKLGFPTRLTRLIPPRSDIRAGRERGSCNHNCPTAAPVFPVSGAEMAGKNMRKHWGFRGSAPRAPRAPRFRTYTPQLVASSSVARAKEGETTMSDRPENVGAGALFKNDCKEKPNQPDYRGDITILGEKYLLAGGVNGRTE